MKTILWEFKNNYKVTVLFFNEGFTVNFILIHT